MHGLLEETARVFGIAVGPEKGEEFVAAQPVRMPDAEQRQQRETMSLDGGARDRTIIAIQTGTTEEGQIEHRRLLTGG